MAGKPDLVGKVFALREDKTDPEQPWLVQCVVHNQGTGPAGTFKVRLTTKIAAMQPGEERSVTVVGLRDFLVPQRGVVQTDPIVTGRGKPVKFKPLVPFSLSIKGSGSEIGFGPIAGDPKGKIKFPGKK